MGVSPAERGPARILLVVGGHPANDDGGEVYLSELAARYPAGALRRFSLSRDHGQPALNWHGHGHAVAPHPREYHVLGPQEEPTPPTYDLNAALRGGQASRLAEDVLDEARRFGADKLWIVLNSPVLIYLAARLIRSSPVPVSVTVWDPPERFAADLNFDARTQALMHEDFGEALRRAASLAVVSEGMREQYLARYEARATVVRQGLPASLFKPAVPPSDGPVTVGFAGNLYASREWRAFCLALDGLGWRIGGREASLVALTDLGVVPEGLKDHGRFPGWLPQDRAVAALSESSVCYLPYFFDPAQRDTVRLCFPSKLSLYAAAGRPVFFHGPPDSSVARFFERYPMGVCCPSLDPAEIAASLERFVVGDGRYGEAFAYLEAARRDELNLDVFLARAASFLGIAPDILRRGEN
jgi:hypothetical protein